MSKLLSMEFKLTNDLLTAIGLVSTDGQPFQIKAEDFPYRTSDPATIRSLQRSPHVAENDQTESVFTFTQSLPEEENN